MNAWDAVIVGAGAAGAILAHRLSEDQDVSVCLLEAGPSDWHPWLHIPAGFIKVLFNDAYTWQFSSEPHAETLGRRVPLPQGRVLGGSSSVNGLVYNRGQREDYDGWAALGLSGPAAVDALARLVPLDLREQAFPPGQVCRAALGHLSMILTRSGPQAFEILVFRSMARTAWHELGDALERVAARASLT